MNAFYFVLKIIITIIVNHFHDKMKITAQLTHAVSDKMLWHHGIPERSFARAVAKRSVCYCMFSCVNIADFNGFNGLHWQFIII